MGLVALEEHLLPADISARLPVGVGHFPPPVRRAVEEAGAERLASMDAAGIDIQVLSLIADEIQGLASADSIELSRLGNDRLAAVVRAHPDRFSAFATLPLSDPAAAVAEVHRAVSELGCIGVMVHGQTQGRFLDDPRFRPVLEAVQAREIPLYLHPAPPPPAVREAYFSDLDAPVAGMLATAGWGWHSEIGIHVLRLVVSGTLERFPALQLIVGHMGEKLPFSLARADERLTPFVDLPRSVAETILDQVHITTSGYTTTPPLLAALLTFGADRIMFSVDYPFSDNVDSADALRAAPLSRDDLKKVGHGNAERLLGLPSRERSSR